MATWDCIINAIDHAKKEYVCLYGSVCESKLDGESSGFRFEQSAAFGIVLAGSGLSEANNECFTGNCFLF